MEALEVASFAEHCEVFELVDCYFSRRVREEVVGTAEGVGGGHGRGGGVGEGGGEGEEEEEEG